MQLEPVSLLIGLVIGLATGFWIKHRRGQAAAEATIRDLKTQLTSVNLRHERVQTELAATKSVVAKLLEDRRRSRDNWEVGQESPLMVVLNDSGSHQLSKVKGIGPKVAVTLASYGINDLERLAEITQRDLSVIEASAPSLAERIIREGWKEQAMELLQDPNTTHGDLDELHDSESDSGTDEYSWPSYRSPVNPKDRSSREQAQNGSSN